MTIKRDKRSEPWAKLLHRDLQSLDCAAGFLKECFAEGPDTFLLGLRHLVEARGGIGKLAKQTGLGRESLYKLLSGKHGGRLSSVILILNALDIEVSFSLEKKSVEKQKRAKKMVGRNAA
jgi:probable addiction module antidote protein